jgi:hypothetical protein
MEVAGLILVSSPPGQFDLCLKSLQQIPAFDPSMEWLEGARGEHTICSGRLMEKKNVLSAQHSSCAKLQIAIEERVFAAGSGKSATSNCRVQHSGDAGKDTFDIMIYRENIQLKKCHATSSIGKYTLTALVGNGEQATLSGSIEATSHSFERGNVRMEANRSFDNNKIRSTKDLEKICRQIQTWEIDFLLSLRDTSNSSLDPRLKCLRRAMPITRTRMDWNIEPHRMIQTLTIGAPMK